MTFQPWREAMQDALYGAHGFYLRERPASHFRTSVTSGPLFATAVRRLAGRIDDALGQPDPFDLVDVGTGGGELIAGLPDVPDRWRLTGLEVGDPWPTEIEGLLFANEWLDNVPLDVLFDDRVVEVDPFGEERLGATAEPELLEWCATWWPRSRRVEVGLGRDRAWAWAAKRVRRGAAVAVDYGHTTSNRRTSLTGFSEGRQVAAVPDGSCDLTAHVALDSCAAATGARLMTQREALLALGLSAAKPDRSLADADPRGYLALLQEAGAAAELMDTRGLGAFGWLVQAIGVDDPLTDSVP
ncbi:MAG: SAM-dependent methyltransferase [Frankiaceae bacterium]|nr:SAM-dependent methyltransferase [Frankiaceae bacterium]